MTFEFILIVLLSISVAVLLRILETHLREIKRLKGIEVAREEELKQRAEKIIRDANDTALRLIQEAHIRAEKIQKQWENNLDAVNDEELKNYKQTLHNISKDIEDSAMREIKQLQSVLQSESVGVQEMVGKKVDEALAQAVAEITSYKEKKIVEINNRMLGFIKEVTLKALGTALSVDQQEDLVMKSLLEAKEGHVF